MVFSYTFNIYCLIEAEHITKTIFVLPFTYTKTNVLARIRNKVLSRLERIISAN